MKPKIATLEHINKEAHNVLGFTFRYHQLNSRPGQFVMLWIPGVDQKPFSIAADTGKSFTVAVYKIKDFTAALFRLKIGGQIGVTGPFGSAFTWKPRQHVMAVGGGYGSAPLAYLIREARKDGCTFELLIGARRKNLLLYPTHFPKHTHIATNDGSAGYKGYVTEVMEQRLKRMSLRDRKRTTVYICGPEPMEYVAAKILRGYRVKCQISIERYIKCGFGICGQCCIDDTGEPMCQVGPIVSGQHALQLTEFGKYYRNKAGVITPYQ